jgi:hypothetical protein
MQLEIVRLVSHVTPVVPGEEHTLGSPNPAQSLRLR